MNKTKNTGTLRASIGLILLTLLATPAASAGEVKIGMSTALSGPAQALGEEMRRGVECYLSRVNKAGVKGNRLRLVALDDGYEPARAAPNMHRLIDEEKVLAVLGNVGTPTAIVSVPIANQAKTLLFGAFTGAGVLRKTPPDRYVINYRASYAEETAAMIDGLLGAGIKPEEIAFFTQNDGYGDAGYSGAVKALKAKGVTHPERLAHGRYTRNTLNVENGLGVILDAAVEPKAVIIVGAYAPVAKFIKMARQDLPDVRFLNVSFVGSRALAKALGSDGEGVIVSQVVPPYTSNLETVRDYRRDLKAFAPSAEPGFVSLEGYIVARLFVEGLRHTGSPPTREGIVDALEGLDAPGIQIGAPVRLSSSEHQASHGIWPTVIRQGRFVAFDWSEL